MPLPWFRRPKATADPAPSQAAVPTAEPEPQTIPEPLAETPAADGSTTPAKKRRRGSRGGRGRKKRPVAGAAEEATTAEPSGAVTTRASARKDTADSDRRSGASKDGGSRDAASKEGASRDGASKEGSRRDRSRSPRRTPQRRAPLPQAKRELLVSVDPGEKRVAVIEDDVVAEVYLERPEQRSIAGNIYLGTVDNVLPGMEAAFVEIGLEKNGFLYVDEIVGPELEGRRGARKIQDLIQRGQTVLVQAVKDPMKTKGARLTTEISLPGRFVVYVPHGDGLGVSRRLDDDERNRLKAIVKEIAPKTGGVIVRTAAEGASAEDVARDLDFLRRLWATIETSAKKAQAPALVYQEAELPLRVTRDLFTGDFERLYVDHDRTYKRIVGYLKKTSPHMVDRVTRYKEREPLLEAFGVEQEIRSTLSRRVDLPSGGYLIFDYAEAFTVIDVNTGRFVGSRSKRNGAGRLEDTITKNNLEAVKEVVRQLRLRDVGGIIVIDFIDMANPKNRQQVEDALRQELERDRTKTYVVEISPLGLVEMTRQNVTDGPREVMTRKCPTCGGDGIIVSDETAAVEVERRIRALVTPGSRSKALKVELNAKVAALIAGSDGARLAELEELTKRRFFFVGLDDVHLDHVRLLEQGTVEKLAPVAPAAAGEELELKLVEIGLYDARTGVGKIDGFEIVVADAAKLVGKKVRVKVTAVMEGLGYAVLIGAPRQAEPITAEAEAERPTRAKRPIKDAEGAGEEVAEDEEAETEAEVVPAPAKAAAQRSRRPAGEKPAARPARAPKAAAEPVAFEDDSTDGSDEVEAAEGVDGETVAAAPKKRTRRGTRGGRNRRRTPAAASADGADAVAGELDAAAEEPSGEASDGVAPDGEETEPVGSALAGDGARAAEPHAPLIHVPGRDLGTDEDDPDGEDGAAGDPARPRKTRRGSRGGRNRRRKPAATGTEAEVLASSVSTPATEPPTGASGDDWEYTPMSEWDKD